MRTILSALFATILYCTPSFAQLEDMYARQCAAGNDVHSCQEILGQSTFPLTPQQRAFYQQKLKDAEQYEKAAKETSDVQDSNFLIFLTIVAAFIIGIVLLVRYGKRAARDDVFNALPKEGPMKVNITTEDMSANVAGYKCLLRFQIVISQQDWHAIAKAGLMQHVLFTSPRPSGDRNDPNNVWAWRIEDLKRGSNSAGFRDVIHMNEAKEELLRGLHALRSQIDHKQRAPQEETFDI